MNAEPPTLTATAKAAWDFTPRGRLAYVDGLRCIAIIAVVAFHARIPGFRGGFVGVDVFFVISGFLITHQIVSQLLTGRFSVIDFYARRVLRIFPPLLLVTAVTLAVAKLFPLLPSEARDLARSGAATAAMVSNYYFTSGTEYFATHSEVNPLLHTWSLGVEEQYYLLAPAFMGGIVALAARRGWSPIRAVLAFDVATIVISYIALVVLTQTDHRLAFFSIMTRAWQFAVGGMLAVAALKGTPVPARLRSPLGVAGLLAIAAAVALYDEHLEYPGFVAGCLPTIGAVLLLASGLGNERAPLIRMLASRPAVTIGVLSYSWYLWHWPLTELARTLPVGQDSLWKDVASSAIALGLSIPTYLFLERPMKALRRADITRPFGGRIVAGGVAGSALIALLALLLARSPAYQGGALQAINLGEPSEPTTGCQAGTKLRFSHIKPCVVGAAGDPSVMFLGDSHALMMTQAAEWSARAVGRTAAVLGLTTCPPLRGVEVDYFTRRVCAASNEEVLAWVRSERAHPIVGAVLTARWSYYNEQDTPAGDANLPWLLWSDPTRRDEGGYAKFLAGGLIDMIKALSPDRRVLIVGPVPELKHPPANCLLRLQLTKQPLQSCAVDRAEVERRRRDAVQTLQRVVSMFPNARLIDPLDALCDRDRCWPFGPKGVFYRDNDHLNPLGTEVLYRHFESDFRWVYGDSNVH